ncbi:MAG: 8-amino-7-oxononanoate synthase [Gammaproteobacteria bacterium]|nr:MAG: 8-amino-7-oxononanoate synthase [Gammaproteobacteria bacterium]
MRKINKIRYDALQTREKNNLTRHRLKLSSPQATQIILDNNDKKSYLNFSSNNYLGLANHPDVMMAMKNAVDKFGVSACSSDMVTGHTVAHHDLEQKLAQISNKPRALIFANGFMANMAINTTLYKKTNFIYQDKLNHSSAILGGLASDATLVRYAHLDAAHLLSKIKVRDGGGAIMSESIFSMGGDFAPLQRLSNIATENDLDLIIDDAHGFGVLGDNGLQVADDYNDNSNVIYMATLGKALGCYGAYVAGSDLVCDTLLQFAPQHIYTTALPVAVIRAADKALDVMQKENWRVEKLSESIHYFKKLASSFNIKLTKSNTAIQPIIIGDNQKTIDISSYLKNNGIIVGAIRPPTVPKNFARLRITLTAEHSPAQIKTLVKAINEAVIFHKLNL